MYLTGKHCIDVCLFKRHGFLNWSWFWSSLARDFHDYKFPIIC